MLYDNNFINLGNKNIKKTFNSICKLFYNRKLKVFLKYFTNQ